MGPKLKLFSGWEMSQEAINCLKHRRKEASWGMEEDDRISEEVVQGWTKRVATTVFGRWK